MISKRKVLLFVSSFVILIGFVASFLMAERRSCMSVPIISEEKIRDYVEVSTLDISQLTFNGEAIAIDLLNNSIYISQSSENLDNVHMFQGKLATTNSEYSLYFLETQEMQDVSLTVREGNPFKLIIKQGETYQRVNLVITTLPILYLDLEATNKTEDGRDLMNGKLTLWDNFDPNSEHYKVSTSDVEWHVRGNSTKIFDKLSWKVNLKKENGENNNLDLLGLGSDDDWILNAMSMDDTKVKEKIAQELWNQLKENTDYNYKMSSGKYAELFINGAYQGLYLLQRRVDEKYLEIDRERDILLKGRNTWEAEYIEDAYEIVSSPLAKDYSYKVVEKTQNFLNDTMNIRNFIDVSLFLQFLSAHDNSGYKNMFYVLKKTDEIYEIYLVPWDTDLSLGATWTYDYEDSIDDIIERRELEIVRKYMPEIDRELAIRWESLRKSIFAEQNIYEICEHATRELAISGAVERNKERWGELNEGEDNWENLKFYIKERLEFLDNYYVQFIEEE